MNFPFYIARRYLFSKKSHNAINVISTISVCGVALATLALVCTLSVFNGFQDLVETFFTAFDPQLKITAVRGKVFDGQDKRVLQLKKLPEVAVYSESLEDNVMVQYLGRQAMAVIKGVEDNFDQLTPIDSILFGRGDLLLHDEVVDYAIPGIQLLSTLGSGIRFLDPLEIYAPRRGAKVNMANPSTGFVTGNLFSSGLVFAVNQEKYDASYILTSMNFARKLFQYTTEVSAINLKLKDGADTDAVKKHIQTLLGDDFRVQDRYEQQADTFRIMEIEKLISYLFLTFILMIACFNVIGSLSMLIIDKRDDVVTLRNLGASDRQIVRIFLFEGRMISLFGALAGVIFGLLLCWLQQEYGLISLGDSGSFVVDAYPVSVHASDVIIVFVTVLLVGFLSVWYPVRFLSKRLLKK
jgi:lipoprotein-releasing system permease protein